MLVFFNDSEFHAENDSILAHILEHQLLVTKNGIAVAVNNKVIPKNEWNHYVLKENDKVLIIQASQGG